MTVHVDRYAFMRWFETGEIMSRDARSVVEVNDSVGLYRVVQLIEQADASADSGTVPQIQERIIFTVDGRPFSEMTLSADGWSEKRIEEEL